MRNSATERFDRGIRSPASTELDDPATIAFGWSAFGQLLKLPHGLVLGGGFQTQLFAGFGLAIECLRDRGRPTHFTEQQHFYFKFPARTGDAQHVADVDFTRRFCELPLRLDSAELASFRRKRTRLEETRGPKPLVDSE